MTRLGAALVFLAVCALGATAAVRIEVSNDVAAFMPDGHDNERAQIFQALLAGENTRGSVYAVGAPSAAAAVVASRAFAERLRRDPEILRVENGFAASDGEGVARLYRSREAYFLSDAPNADTWSDTRLRTAFRRLTEQLALPTGGLARSLATRDPFMVFQHRVDALAAMRPEGLVARDGVYLTRDERHAVLFVTSRESPFAAAKQAPLLRRIEQAFAAVNANQHGRLTLAQSGFARFAVASELAIRNDVTRISILSAVGVILFTLLLFRSVRFLLLTFVPVVVGMAAAVSVSYAVFGAVHGITLAFGCALIGVTEDYPVHLLNHHTFAGKGTTPAQSLKRVWIGLLLGAGTTTVGLLGLGSTTFSAMREIAVFASTGVIGALLATRYLVPPFLPVAEAAPPQARVALTLERVLAAFRRRPRVVGAVWLVALLVVAVGLPRVRWNDDLSRLNAEHPEWRAEDARVRALVGAPDATRMVVALGRDDNTALRVNDAVAEALQEATVAQEVTSFQSAHSILWSRETQEESAESARRADGFGERFRALASEVGFRDSVFDPFLRELGSPTTQPLSYEEVRTSPLGTVLQRFRLSLPQSIAYVTFLRGVQHSDALNARIASISGAVYLDQKEFLRDAYGAFRTRTLQLLALGALGVLLIALVRYRRIRAVVAVCFPAWTAAATTLGILGLVGVEGNLMHLLALVLVLSMGIDYGIFMAEHSEESELPSTLLSVVAATVTTILSFGLLALSTNPALRSLGMATGIGLALCMVLAPLALISLRGDGSRTA